MKHKFIDQKVVEIDQHGVKSTVKLRKKVFALMDHNIPDLIGNRSGEMKSKMNRKDAVDDFDISLMCRIFPSITLGSAPQVGLYDGTTTYSETNIISATKDFEQHLYDSSEVREVQNTVSEASPSLYVNRSSLTSSPLRKDDSFPCPLTPQSMSSIYEKKLDQVTREDSQKKVGLQSQSNLTLNELSLDTSVNFLPGLTKKQREQLDNCGFHTLRKLLHHFPRSYANLQNAHGNIYDGQYLMFVGEVLSSRGVRANCSISLLEVIVGCQIADRELDIEHVTDKVGKTKTVYLHLKRFFRGTRFTFKGFLNSIANKYQVGDIACVSGKVKTMPTKDHYEMREFNIDVLEDGKDLSLCAKERPYCIYPSKGGLNPTFLRDIIARFVLPNSCVSQSYL